VNEPPFPCRTEGFEIAGKSLESVIKSNNIDNFETRWEDRRDEAWIQCSAPVPRICSHGALGLGLVDARAALAGAPSYGQGPEPIANAEVMGATVFRGKSKGQRYGFRATLVVPGGRESPGASTAFGVDDAGKIKWMGRTEYQPAIGMAQDRRPFETPNPPYTTEQGPRYLMVCAWALSEDRKPLGPMHVGYAERDDARTVTSKDGTLLQSITMHWTSIPSARARDRFGKADLCGEVAKTGTSFVPKWLLDGKPK
jgi:hypothetical protein